MISNVMSIDQRLGNHKINPDEPVVAKRKSRFIRELKI